MAGGRFCLRRAFVGHPRFELARGLGVETVPVAHLLLILFNPRDTARAVGAASHPSSAHSKCCAVDAGRH